MGRGGCGINESLLKTETNQIGDSMILEKLIFENGILQNKEVGGIPVHTNTIEPFGRNNVRTLIPMENPIGITNHNTGNSHKTDDDRNQAI